MPELPEVETIVRGLKTKVLHAKIEGVKIRPSPVFRSKDSLKRHLPGKEILAVSRHGKAMFLKLSDGFILRIHLGMTGQLLLVKKGQTGDAYTRAEFILSDAETDLHYRDIRQFGKIEFVDADHEPSWGPDAWDASLGDLVETLMRKKGMLKNTLLNQNVIAGLGNIYVDESLFISRFRPKRQIGTLRREFIEKLCINIKQVLAKSLAVGGTSFRNYVDTAGGRGGFKSSLMIYGKEGKPCVVCGFPVKKMVVAARGTHYCPKCQK